MEEISAFHTRKLFQQKPLMYIIKYSWVATTSPVHSSPMQHKVQVLAQFNEV